jgi:hypothetical protein
MLKEVLLFVLIVLLVLNEAAAPDIRSKVPRALKHQKTTIRNHIKNENIGNIKIPDFLNTNNNNIKTRLFKNNEMENVVDKVSNIINNKVGHGDSSSSSEDAEVETNVEASCTATFAGYLNSGCSLGKTESTTTFTSTGCTQGSRGNWGKYKCATCSTGQNNCLWVVLSTTQSGCESSVSYQEYVQNVCTKNPSDIGFYGKLESFNYATCCSGSSNDIDDNTEKSNNHVVIDHDIRHRIQHD